MTHAESPSAASDSPLALPEEGVDVSISMEQANLIASILFPLIAAPLLGLFWAVWGWDALRDGFVSVFFTWWFVPIFLAAVVVHEGLHALGFLLFGRAPRGAIHFGIHRETLSPYAGCRAAVRAGAYRMAVLLPALLLGVLPIVVGMAAGDGWLVIWGTLMLVAAGGDLTVIWAVRGVPSRQRVIDHPTRVGCRVLADG